MYLLEENFFVGMAKGSDEVKFKVGKHLFKEVKIGRKHFVEYDEGKIPIPAKLSRESVDKIAEYIKKMFKKKHAKKSKPKVAKHQKLIRPAKVKLPEKIEVKRENITEHKGLPNSYRIRIEGIPSRFIHEMKYPKTLMDAKAEKEGKRSDGRRVTMEEPIISKTGIHHFASSGKIEKLSSRSGESGHSGMTVRKGHLVSSARAPEPSAEKIKEMQSKGYIYDLEFRRFYRPGEPAREERVKGLQERADESKREREEEEQEDREREAEQAEFDAEEAMEEQEENERRERRAERRVRQEFLNYLGAHDEGRQSREAELERDLQAISEEAQQRIDSLHLPAAAAAAPSAPPSAPSGSAPAALPDESLGYFSSLVSSLTGRGVSEAVPDVQPLSLGEIQEMMGKIPGYLGTVMSDQLKSLPWSKSEDNYCIFNKSKMTDNDNGTHWEAIVLSPEKSKSLEIYDSLANPIQGHVMKQMEEIIQGMNLPYEIKLKTNRKRDQLIYKDGNSTNSCGFFAMDFLNHRINGKKFSEASGYGSPSSAEKALIPLEKRFKYLKIRNST